MRNKILVKNPNDENYHYISKHNMTFVEKTKLWFANIRALLRAIGDKNKYKGR